MLLFIAYLILSFQDVLDPDDNLLRLFLLGAAMAIVLWLWKSRKNVPHPPALPDDRKASLSDDNGESPRLTVERDEDLRGFLSGGFVGMLTLAAITRPGWLIILATGFLWWAALGDLRARAKMRADRERRNAERERQRDEQQQRRERSLRDEWEREMVDKMIQENRQAQLSAGIGRTSEREQGGGT